MYNIPWATNLLNKPPPTRQIHRQTNQSTTPKPAPRHRASHVGIAKSRYLLLLLLLLSPFLSSLLFSPLFSSRPETQSEY